MTRLNQIYTRGVCAILQRLPLDCSCLHKNQCQELLLDLDMIIRSLFYPYSSSTSWDRIEFLRPSPQRVQLTFKLAPAMSSFCVTPIAAPLPASAGRRPLQLLPITASAVPLNIFAVDRIDDRHFNT